MVWVTKNDEENYFPKKCVPEQQMDAAFANTYQDHLCLLHVSSKGPSTRLTGIGCIIGISSREVEVLEDMIENGMNIAVIDFSHGTHSQHYELLQNIRTANRNYSKKIRMTSPLAVGMMTRGPILRTQFPVGGTTIDMTVYKGDTVYLTGDEEYILKENPPNTIHVNYPDFHKVMKKGKKVVIKNKRAVLVCTGIKGTIVVCKALHDGNVRHNNCISLPGVKVDLYSLPEKDKCDIRFAVRNDIDMIFAGRIRSKAVVDEIREVLGSRGQHIKVISQIGNQQAMENLDEIIKVSDGIMISRLDLANEMNEEELFIAQKSIVSKCNACGKPVTISSYLFEHNPKNFRTFAPESSDIANAVIDGVDVILLCRETSVGNFPAETVRKVGNICRQAEAAIWQKQLVRDLSRTILPPTINLYAVAAAAVEISMNIMAPAIIVISSSLKSAHLMIKYRPKCPVIAVTRNARCARQAHIFRGIVPLIYKAESVPDWAEEVTNRLYHGVKFGQRNGFIVPGDTVVVMTCSKQGAGFTDRMTIFYVPFSHGGSCVC